MKHPPVALHMDETDFSFHEERGDLWIELRVKVTGVSLGEWRNDDARQMFEDGFFDARRLHASVFEYWADVFAPEIANTRTEWLPADWLALYHAIRFNGGTMRVADMQNGELALARDMVLNSILRQESRTRPTKHTVFVVNALPDNVLLREEEEVDVQLG